MITYTPSDVQDTLNTLLVEPAELDVALFVDISMLGSLDADSLSALEVSTATLLQGIATHLSPNGYFFYHDPHFVGGVRCRVSCRDIPNVVRLTEPNRYWSPRPLGFTQIADSLALSYDQDTPLFAIVLSDGGGVEFTSSQLVQAALESRSVFVAYLGIGEHINTSWPAIRHFTTQLRDLPGAHASCAHGIESNLRDTHRSDVILSDMFRGYDIWLDKIRQLPIQHWMPLNGESPGQGVDFIDELSRSLRDGVADVSKAMNAVAVDVGRVIRQGVVRRMERWLYENGD